MDKNVTLESLNSKLNSFVDAVNKYEHSMKDPCFHRAVEKELASRCPRMEALTRWLTSNSLLESSCIIFQTGYSIDGAIICHVALSRTCSATEIIDEIIKASIIDKDTSATVNNE